MNQEAQNTQNGMINVSLLLPESFKDFIDQQVTKGGYSTPDEYLCDLVREARERAVEEHLEQLLLEGLDSGDPIEVTPEYWLEKRAELIARYGNETEVERPPDLPQGHEEPHRNFQGIAR